MRFKNFVEKTKVAQDKDVDELPGTQPSKYYSGVDKDDKEKRAKQFARQAKMSDDDPRAYKPAPGDKGTETKPSKYTKKFKQMYGERALTPAEKDKMREYEKKIDKKDFIDRYGEEEGERIYWATITKMAKKNEDWSQSYKDSIDCNNPKGFSQRAHCASKKKNEGENVAVARERIKREKEADKAKHDAMLDRARTADTRTKNRQESVSEDAPRWIKDLIGNKMHPKQYKKAEELLRDLIARKKKEAGRKGLKHSIEYYAAQIARNFANVDARNLARMVQEDDDPCWDGYKQVGMKKKNGKMVPNCVQEARAKQAVAGNKVQKLVTGFGMTYKGKKYDEIDFELMGIDNSTQVVTFRILHPKEHIGDEVKIPFKTLRRGRFMATDTSKINEEVSQKQIDDLERFADRLLAKFKVDVEFTKHFKDRMNDKRNSPEIKVVELQKLFKKIQKNKAKNIQGNAGLEAVLKDLSSDLNLPVVIKQRGDEIELVNKTIMRKSDFKTTSKIIKYEEFTSMDEASRADMKVRKRPHMMLKAGNAGVKFDGRFKIYKNKQVLQDAEKPLEESKFPDKQVKMAIGIASDKRYKGGNYSGAVKSIEKIAKGLSNHPQVAAVLKRQNEDFDIEEQILDLMESTESLFEDPNKSLQNKSDKSGIKKSILKKVYDRGVAAWRTGHRPGTTPEQWGLARVNSFITGGKTRTTADADLWKQRNEEMELEEKRDPRKSGGSGYDLYHKDFSSAMQHAYKYAKDKLGVDIDPEEIDSKVASGPRKPSSGKTNSYRLTDKSGKKAVQIQVYNMDNKKYELNMYKEDVDIDTVFESLIEETLEENAKHKKAIDKAHKFFVKTSKGKSERIQEKNRFAAMEMLKKELENAGASETDMMKAFGELDKHIMKVMDESVELDEAKLNVKAIQKAVDDGKSMDVIMTMFANKRTTNTDEIRKVVKDYMWKKRMKKEEVETLEEGVNDPGIFKAVFLAGGPGSGKSFMVGKTALTTLGLKLINSDPAFEAQLKKVGLKATPDDIFTDKGQAARAKAKSLTAKQQELALNGRLGLVIDGTGKDYDKIQKQAIGLKKLGYEVAMIFVNTNLKTAIDRDAKRDRTLGAKEVTKMWNAVQDNIGKFQKFFGTMMVIVDNSDGADWQTGSTTAYKKMQKWVSTPPKSPEAKKWIEDQKKQRGITEEDAKLMESKVLEYGTTRTTEVFKKSTPGEKLATKFLNKKNK